MRLIDADRIDRNLVKVYDYVDQKWVNIFDIPTVEQKQTTLIDKAALLNRIATEVHYDSERSLEMYAKLLSEINDAPVVSIEVR